MAIFLTIIVFLLFGAMVWVGWYTDKKREEAHKQDMIDNPVWYAMGGK